VIRTNGKKKFPTNCAICASVISNILNHIKQQKLLR
jgi:hypothetical protein